MITDKSISTSRRLFSAKIVLRWLINIQALHIFDGYIKLVFAVLNRAFVLNMF